jgi:hypothetical protein
MAGPVRTVTAALGLMLFGGAASACDEPQVALASYDEPALRTYLVAALDELESYFEVEFSSVCMDREEFGAYVMPDGQLVVGAAFAEVLGSQSLNNISAMLAHETAHRFQKVHGLLDKLVFTDRERVKCIELHADFMAGGFMRWRAEYMKVAADDLAEMFFDLGDQAVHDFDHHGLGGERFVAFTAGYSTLYDTVYTNSTMGMVYVSLANCDPF